MPKKYHIDTKPAPARFTPIGKHGIVDFNEDCAGACKNCVKNECIYEIYKKEGVFTREMEGPLHYLYNCMNCLRCVQNCTRQVLTRTINPEFKWLGDEYWKPEMLLTLQYQSEEGNLPVSGAGYRGPFSGPGFDSMWTDMSEIVRPTRDGIHGREYISTSVDIGKKHLELAFDTKGNLAKEILPVHELPVPFIMANPHFGDFSPNVFESFARAAHTLGTFYVLEPEQVTKNIAPYKSAIAPAVKSSNIAKNSKLIKGAKIVQLEYDRNVTANIKAIKKVEPNAVVCVKTALTSDSHLLAERLAEKGVEAIYFHANFHGDVETGRSSEFIKDTFRRIHSSLVDRGLRDRITLIAGGGIALAEHMAKIIICGADLFMLDIPFLIAMECRMCMNCTMDRECPVEMASISPEYGSNRITNLSAALRNQLLELLGAMGIREVRRLRGEYGRAMFQEDLERETFQKLFSGRKANKK